MTEEKKLTQPFIKNFKKAFGIFRHKGYLNFSIQKLYFARVIWLASNGEKERNFGPCFCADLLVPVENGYEMRHLLLRAWSEEENITIAKSSQIRMIRIEEGDIFDYGDERFKLLHGQIITPKNVMDLDTVVEIFAESGLVVSHKDIMISRFTYEHNGREGLQKRTIGVCFLAETVIDGQEYIAFVRAFRGTNSRIAEFVKRDKCEFKAYPDSSSFRTSSGEWALIKGELRDYKEFLRERLAATKK